jgi:hypothetical protein
MAQPTKSIMGPMGLETKNTNPGKGQQQFTRQGDKSVMSQETETYGHVS